MLRSLIFCSYVCLKYQYLSIYPFICPSLSNFLPLSLLIHPSIHPSIRPSVYPSIRLSVYPSVHPSIYMGVPPIPTCKFTRGRNRGYTGAGGGAGGGLKRTGGEPTGGANGGRDGEFAKFRDSRALLSIRQVCANKNLLRRMDNVADKSTKFNKSTSRRVSFNCIFLRSFDNNLTNCLCFPGRYPFFSPNRMHSETKPRTPRLYYFFFFFFFFFSLSLSLSLQILINDDRRRAITGHRSD